MRAAGTVFIRGIIIAAFLSVASSVRGGIAFDNLGSGNTYRNYGAWFGNYAGNTSIEATDFVPSDSGLMSRITAAMFQESSLDQVILSLRSNQSGHPGTILWQQTFNNELGSYGSVAVFDQLLNPPTIAAGTTYWMVAKTPDDGVTMHAWYDGLVGSGSVARTPTEGGSWIVYQNVNGRGLRVETTTVPEPQWLGWTVAAWLFVPVTLIRRRKMTLVR